MKEGSCLEACFTSDYVRAAFGASMTPSSGHGVICKCTPPSGSVISHKPAPVHTAEAVSALPRNLQSFAHNMQSVRSPTHVIPAQVDGQSIPAYNALYVATMQDSSDTLNQASNINPHAARCLLAQNAAC